MISCILFIFINLGKREKGTLSAYSVFNKDNQKLLGEFGSENVDSMFGINHKKIDDDPRLQRENLSKNDTEFDLTKASKWGNLKCPCGSD